MGGEVAGDVAEPLEAGEGLFEVEALGLGEGGEHAGGDGGGEHGHFGAREGGRVAREEEGGEQDAELVPREDVPGSGDALGGGETVCVRVGGEDEGDVVGVCGLHGEVEGAFFLGVGEGDGGEVRVGVGLGVDDEHGGGEA